MFSFGVFSMFQHCFVLKLQKYFVDHKTLNFWVNCSFKLNNFWHLICLVEKWKTVITSVVFLFLIPLRLLVKLPEVDYQLKVKTTFDKWEFYIQTTEISKCTYDFNYIQSVCLSATWRSYSWALIFICVCVFASLGTSLQAECEYKQLHYRKFCSCVILALIDAVKQWSLLFRTSSTAGRHVVVLQSDVQTSKNV